MEAALSRFLYILYLSSALSEVMQKITVRDKFNQQEHGFLQSATTDHVNNILVRTQCFHQLNFFQKLPSLVTICHTCR